MPDADRALAAISLLGLTERMRHHNDASKPPKPVVLEALAAAVLDTLNGRLSPTEATLLREIAGLGRIIEQTKSEIAEVSFDAIRGIHIPSATDELDAIVQHTAIATDNILESCELLDRLAGELSCAQAETLNQAITRIYEACSFQDITGQRITKIVKALKAIEAKVAGLSAISGQQPTLAIPASAGVEALLNGPGLPHVAMGQDAIDKLLAEF